jgi:hypothetical protein
VSDKRRPDRCDTAAPWAPAPVAEPTGRYAALAAFDPYQEVATPAVGVAAVPQRSVDIVPAEVYQVYTPGPSDSTALLPAFAARIPTSVVPARRARPRRQRWQLAVATAVALAGLAAIGVGYVAITRTADSTEAKAPSIPAAPSIDGTLHTEGAAPGADPVGTLPADPTAAATTTSPATAATSATTDGGVNQPAIVVPTVDSASPAGGAPPSPMQLQPRAAAPATAGTVDAAFSYTAQRADDGISRYVGTIEIDNSRAGDATDWRLTLTVPGGNLVVAHGPVDVTQNGESVQFTPSGDGGAVPAGGSLTFTFTVRGTLAALPANCTINGRACS